MTDLVQRLRIGIKDVTSEVHMLCHDAADRIEQLEAEIQEQCRINGMGAERELALMAKVEKLERENAELCKDANRYRWLRNADMDQRNRVEHYAESALDVFVDSAMKENK